MNIPRKPSAFALTCGLSILLALAETATTFPNAAWAALRNRWVCPIYEFYGLIPLLIGAILREHQSVQSSPASARLCYCA